MNVQVLGTDDVLLGHRRRRPLRPRRAQGRRLPRRSASRRGRGEAQAAVRALAGGPRGRQRASRSGSGGKTLLGLAGGQQAPRLRLGDDRRLARHAGDWARTARGRGTSRTSGSAARPGPCGPSPSRPAPHATRRSGATIIDGEHVEGFDGHAVAGHDAGARERRAHRRSRAGRGRGRRVRQGQGRADRRPGQQGGGGVGLREGGGQGLRPQEGRPRARRDDPQGPQGPRGLREEPGRAREDSSMARRLRPLTFARAAELSDECAQCRFWEEGLPAAPAVRLGRRSRRPGGVVPDRPRGVGRPRTDLLPGPRGARLRQVRAHEVLPPRRAGRSGRVPRPRTPSCSRVSTSATRRATSDSGRSCCRRRSRT